MRYLVTGREMSLYDKQTSEYFHVPPVVLMEQAAQAFVEKLMELTAGTRVLVVCGTGNNGGDGIAIARLLNQRGIRAEVYAPVNGHRTSELFTLQYEIYQAYGYPVIHSLESHKMCGADGDINNEGSHETNACRYFGEGYDIVVDAIFGTGLSKPVAGDWADIINCMNSLPGRKVAVDIPSGVSADTGEILGTAFMADWTITFSFAKLGQYLWPGTARCGKVIVAPIGITEESFIDTVPGVRFLEDEDLSSLPSRKPNSHKGSYGKLLVIAGSADMAGAAVFAAKAAYRMGTGLVKVMTPECNRLIIQTQVPEAILSTYKDEMPVLSDACNDKRQVLSDTDKNEELRGSSLVSEADEKNMGTVITKEWYDSMRDQVSHELAWADALVIGPGIGTGPAARAIVSQVLKEADVPMVLDADALNIISLEEWHDMLRGHILRQSADTDSRGGRPACIITPHIGEMSRLTGKSARDIKQNLFDTAADFAKKYQVVCVLKDARTVTAAPDGKKYLNLSGNNGMATAGSGDVLSGILGGLLAQGISPDEAAPLGVYFHGRAGDAARDKLGARYMMASDIIEGMAL